MPLGRRPSPERHLFFYPAPLTGTRNPANEADREFFLFRILFRDDKRVIPPQRVESIRRLWMSGMASFTDLDVWKVAHRLTLEPYPTLRSLSTPAR